MLDERQSKETDNSSFWGSLTAIKDDVTLNKTCSPELSFGLRKISITCFAALALLAIVTPAKANLVVNGSFETTTLTASGQVTFSAGQVLGWTTPTSVQLGFLYFPSTQNAQLSDQFGANNFQLWQGITNTIPNTSPDGGKWLTLDAAPTYQGSISQTIGGLTIAKDYTLSFYQAAGQQHNFDGQTTEQWKVTFGSQTFKSTLMTNPTHDFQPWNQQTMTFTASAAIQTLTFLSQGGPDGLPPFVFLDGVSLVQTPEPSSLVYTCLGLSGLIAFWRLRKKRA
jgi:hypothetical protein